MNKEAVHSAFVRADRLLDRGRLRQAFLIFLALAKAKDASSQLNVGYLYDRGIGTRKNSAKALYWYRRAWREGDASGANNIGTIYRDRHNAAKALAWFTKSVKAGNDGSLLEIAKIHIKTGSSPKRVAQFLRRVITRR